MKKPTNSEIKKIINQIAELLNDGWSIIPAKKKACGSITNNTAKAVHKSDLYVFILNSYLKEKKRGSRFVNENGKLKQVTKETYNLKNNYNNKQ